MKPLSAPKRTPKSDPQVLLLVAPQFEEEFLACCLSQLRSAGLAVRVVSAVAGAITGSHGLTIVPDEMIDPLWRSATPPRLVILPDGSTCASALLIDPRVHQLLGRTLRAGGYLAAPSAAQAVVLSAGLTEAQAPSHCLMQNQQELGEFVGEVVRVLMVK
jgi:putative intracellular protease/amidase